MTPDRETPFPRRFSWPMRILLGLFVLWQAQFLFSANLLRMLDDSRPYWKQTSFLHEIAPDWVNQRGRTSDLVTYVRRVDKRWGELTGQPQSWSLFAPSVFEHIPFPVLEYRWDDDEDLATDVASGIGALLTCSPLAAASHWLATSSSSSETPPPPLFLKSANEPEDVHCFFRFGRFRLRRYDANMVVILATRDRAREEVAEKWRSRIVDHVREENDVIHAYLRWRLGRFQQDHPQLPAPSQIILKSRLYRIPPPPGNEPWDWQRFEEPILRWRPQAANRRDCFPLEPYDPVNDCFSPLLRTR